MCDYVYKTFKVAIIGILVDKWQIYLTYCTINCKQSIQIYYIPTCNLYNTNSVAHKIIFVFSSAGVFPCRHPGEAGGHA